MKPLTLRKCLTCVHWQWQLRVQEALNLFVSVHLPSSNASSFVWHDLCCPHFAIKKTYVLYEQVIANKQQALSSLISRLFCSLQVIVLPFSELGTVFQNMFWVVIDCVLHLVFRTAVSIVEIVHWCSGVTKKKDLTCFSSHSAEKKILLCQKENTQINALNK